LHGLNLTALVDLCLLLKYFPSLFILSVYNYVPGPGNTLVLDKILSFDNLGLIEYANVWSVKFLILYAHGPGDALSGLLLSS